MQHILRNKVTRDGQVRKKFRKLVELDKRAPTYRMNSKSQEFYDFAEIIQSRASVKPPPKILRAKKTENQRQKKILL